MAKVLAVGFLGNLREVRKALGNGASTLVFTSSVPTRNIDYDIVVTSLKHVEECIQYFWMWEGQAQAQDPKPPIFCIGDGTCFLPLEHRDPRVDYGALETLGSKVTAALGSH